MRTRLLAVRSAFVTIPAVEDWVKDHNETKFRYKFLVLSGESGLGKTQFCVGLVPRGRALELNMAATEDPDLRAYDHAEHDLILFDEMAARCILKHKKLFQAPPVAIGMANSATNCHAFRVWVHQKLLVVSTNRWDFELHTMPYCDKEWLECNSVVVRVTRPLWVTE